MRSLMALVLVSLTGLILLSTTCNKNTERCHHRVPLYNNSPKAIYKLFTTHYPDSLSFNGMVDPTGSPISYKLEPGDYGPFFPANYCVEDYLNLNPSRTIILYVFDANVIEHTPWDSVKKHYMVLKQYNLTIDSFRNRNWRVDYP